MSSNQYEKIEFKIALYKDKQFKIQDVLSKELKDSLVSHYSKFEELLEDIYEGNINLILLDINILDEEMEYILNILNDQVSVEEEIVIVAIADKKLIDEVLLEKYSEIDFISSPINYLKIKYRIKMYRRFFEKQFELKRAKNLVKKELETVQALFDVHEGMLLLFREDEFIMINKQFLQFTNFKNIDDFYLNSSKKFVLENGELHCLSQGNNEWIDELLKIEESKRIVLMENSEGVKRSFKVGINKFTLENEHTLISFDDITNLYNQAKIYEEYAHYDPLTSLANRRKFDEDVQKQIKAHKRHNHELSLLIIDIDHFKKINDTFGHNEGDSILKLLANLLQEHVREEDLVSRWGGEEFVILLPFTSEKDAFVVAESLRKKVHYITLADGKELSCSIGLAQYSDELTLEEWISNADEALYEAKESGRNNVKVFKK